MSTKEEESARLNDEKEKLETKKKFISEELLSLSKREETEIKAAHENDQIMNQLQDKSQFLNKKVHISSMLNGKLLATV